MKHLFIIAALLISVAFAGCSNNVPLGGRITFADNGEPLTEGTIAFVRGNVQARSGIDADGRYNLSFAAVGDGLPKGEYQIYIQAVHVELQYGSAKDPNGDPEATGRTETRLIAQKYESPETSGLKFFVDGKTKVFDIKVERYAATPEK